MGTWQILSAAIGMGAIVVSSLGSKLWAAESPVGWRGNGTGTFVAAYPPIAWSADDNVLWKTPLPGGSFASPILVADRLFVLSQPADLLCLNAETGEILWQKSHTWADLFGAERGAEIDADLKQAQTLKGEIRKLRQQQSDLQRDSNGKDASPEEKKIKADIAALEDQVQKLSKYPAPGGGPHANSRSTPTSDGEAVYITLGNGMAARYTLEGERTWFQFIEAPVMDFGHTASPLLIDGKLIVHFHNLIALDPQSGDEVWRAELPPRHGSPLAARVGDRDYVVTSAGAIVEARDGRVLHKGLFQLNESSPLVHGDLLFAAENGRNGMKAWKLEAAEDGVDAQLLWERTPPSERRFASLVYFEGLLYSVAGPILEVIDASTGELVYRERLSLDGRSYPSPVVAGGKVFISGDGGETAIIEPGREYVEVGRNALEPFGNNLLFAGERLYIRGMKNIYCITRGAEPR